MENACLLCTTIKYNNVHIGKVSLYVTYHVQPLQCVMMVPSSVLIELDKIKFSIYYLARLNVIRRYCNYASCSCTMATFNQINCVILANVG